MGVTEVVEGHRRVDSGGLLRREERAPIEARRPQWLPLEIGPHERLTVAPGVERHALRFEDGDDVGRDID